MDDRIDLPRIKEWFRIAFCWLKTVPGMTCFAISNPAKAWPMFCKSFKEFFCGPAPNGYTLEEIIEGMKEVPEEEIRHLLPIKFACALNLILEEEEKQKRHSKPNA